MPTGFCYLFVGTPTYYCQRNLCLCIYGRNKHVRSTVVRGLTIGYPGGGGGAMFVLFKVCSVDVQTNVCLTTHVKKICLHGEKILVSLWK